MIAALGFFALAALCFGMAVLNIWAAIFLSAEALVRVLNILVAFFCTHTAIKCGVVGIMSWRQR